MGGLPADIPASPRLSWLPQDAIPNEEQLIGQTLVFPRVQRWASLTAVTAKSRDEAIPLRNIAS